MSKLDARRTIVARLRHGKRTQVETGAAREQAVLVVALLDQILDHLAAERAKPVAGWTPGSAP